MPTTDSPIGRPKGSRKAKRKYRRTMGRSRESYLPKTPEAKARQAEGRRKAGAILKARAAARREGERVGWRRPPFSDDAKWKRIYDATILEFAKDEQFLGLDLYPGQEVLLRAQYGLEIPSDLFPLYQTMTTLSQVPEHVPGRNEDVFEEDVEKTEGVWVIGRRGTKSSTAAIIALYEATRGHWFQYLPEGRRPWVILFATRQQQAEEIIGDEIRALVANAGPTLEGIVADEWRYKCQVDLANGVRIASFPTSATAPRGHPTICLIMDEVAWFFQEGPKADIDILNSVRPNMAQFGGHAKTFLISSPSAKSGILWDCYAEGCRIPERLTVQATTLEMNPAIAEKFVEKERARDPDMAEREYDALFAEKREQLFSGEMLDAAMILVGDQPYRQGYRYIAGLDASGLAGRDRFGFAIAHRDERGRVSVDVVRSWDATDHGPIFAEMGHLCRMYGVAECWIDRFAQGYVRSLLAEQGVEAMTSPLLSSVMINTKTLMLGGRLEMPLDGELRDGLEKTQIFYSRSNQPSVGRERSKFGHGDKADGVTRAIWGASKLDEREHVEVVTFDAVEEIYPAGLVPALN